MTAAVFIGFTGFTLVMPFLPLYLGELGVADVGEIAFWAGLSLGITPAITALCAPGWGRLADRFGRKIMVLRSLASFVVVMAAMAYVTQAWHIFALRAVQGFFAGYGALALTMAADSSPPGRLAQSIALVQSAQRLGPALGPVIGGAIAQVVGLRGAFFVSSGFYLFGFLLVLFTYKERWTGRRWAGQGTSGSARPVPPPVSLREVLRFEDFPLIMAVIFALQFVDRSFGPVLPLRLAAIGVPLDRVAVVSGVMFSLMAGAGALGNTICARLLPRMSARLVITLGGMVGSLASLAFVVAHSPAVLYGAAALFGLALGSATTAAYTAGGSVVPADIRGAGFGLLTSASLSGLAVSPMFAGLLGRTSILAVFLLDVVLLALLAIGVARLMASRVGVPGGAATPRR